eukprot:5411756-Prymnesium_polylepis.1
MRGLEPLVAVPLLELGHHPLRARVVLADIHVDRPPKLQCLQADLTGYVDSRRLRERRHAVHYGRRNHFKAE